jgi:hypothetical protein
MRRATVVLPFDQQQGGDLADAGLHRHQPDEIPLDLVENAADTGFGIQRLQIDHAIDHGRRRFVFDVRFNVRKGRHDPPAPYRYRSPAGRAVA